MSATPPLVAGMRPFGVLGTLDPVTSPAGAAALLISTGVAGAAAWPTANLALYFPVLVERRVTAYQIAVEVGTQSGNLDVGIYDELGARLVSSGSTAVAAAGTQVVNITDTVLQPGVYFLAMAASSGTAQFNRTATNALIQRGLGVRQEASALPLPATATFAAMAQAYVPTLAVSTVATI